MKCPLSKHRAACKSAHTHTQTHTNTHTPLYLLWYVHDATRCGCDDSLSNFAVVVKSCCCFCCIFLLTNAIITIWIVAIVVCWCRLLCGIGFSCQRIVGSLYSCIFVIAFLLLLPACTFVLVRWQ